ncbi:MAG: hypothetical protein KME04_20775 [Pleurocapsa minor GSE-CHR-MK-17-07R]|jgi:transposase|nr:hypothetical protein [Pleurocapsa minor GSE-CHR-MK 17-07R]
MSDPQPDAKPAQPTPEKPVVEITLPPIPNYSLSSECPACGFPTVRRVCKVRCDRCGFMWDCSEL